MAGHNIQRLLNAVAGMNRADVETSRAAWERGSQSLERVIERLSYAAPKVREGFGEHSESGVAAEQALVAVRDKVARRRQDMADATAALQLVLDAMDEAKDASATMPREAPGSAPRLDLPPGGDVQQEVTALKIHAARTRQHNEQVAAYDEADARAEQKVRRLNEAYGNAADTLARIHGEPVTVTPGGDAADGGPAGAGPARPTGGRLPGSHPTIGTIGGPTDHGTGTDEGTGSGDSDGTDQPVVPEDPVLVDPGGADPGAANPSVVTPAPTGDGISLGGPVGGAGLAGLGILGGAGLRGILGGGASPVATGSTPATRPIGGTTRTGASGTLGRTGATSGVPGQAAGRGATAGGAGGRGAPGRGAPGRGAPGTRGAAAAGAVSGRNRNRKDDERDPGQVYDVEDAWTDDEEQFPGVISQ